MGRSTVASLFMLAFATFVGVRIPAQASEQGLAAAPGLAAADSQTFADVPPSHPYYAEIEWLYQNGYTAGCAVDPLRYCPDATMNRAESAVFVERGIHTASYDPPVPTTQVFGDLALDSWAAKWVNGLWEDEYTAGCGTDPLMYCPWQGHTRAEGCVFYLRMLYGANYEPPQPSRQTFADVPLDSWYAKWVQAAYDAGLIPGCQSSPQMRFCPDDALSRGLAAYMMVRAKSGPAPTPTALPPTVTPVAPTSTPTATRTPTEGNTFYVSKAGNNRDGLSWTTAWNELNQIRWALIQPGDTIFIDGGATSCNSPVAVSDSSNQPSPAGCGMVYTTTLTVSASGTETEPIKIQMSDEAGRNGTVRIFGGRSRPLGYCGQTDYVLGNANSEGIYSGEVGRGYGHIVIDGRKWGGIMIYGTNNTGIFLYHWGIQTDWTFRNIEIFDNGYFSGTTPDGWGVSPTGSFLTFERMLIHDNGQDSFQTCYVGDYSNITIRDSWLYNQRPHPTDTSDSWNACSHSDGVMYCTNTINSGFTVENSIIGPGFMQGFIFGGYNKTPNGVLNNVTVRNSLIVDHHGASSNSGFTVLQTSPLATGYTFDHVTVVRDIGRHWWSLSIPATDINIYNSLFYGGYNLGFSEQPDASNNYSWQVADSRCIDPTPDDGINDCANKTFKIALDKGDPKFRDGVFDGIAGDPTSPDTTFAGFDFTITNPAIPAGVGSSIHTVADLLGQPAASASPSASPAAAPIPCLGADNLSNGDDAKTWAASSVARATSPDFVKDNGINDLGFLFLHRGAECTR